MDISIQSRTKNFAGQSSNVMRRGVWRTVIKTRFSKTFTYQCGVEDNKKRLNEERMSYVNAIDMQITKTDGRQSSKFRPFQNSLSSFFFSREPRLYKRVCPSVGPSVRPSIGPSVGRSVRRPCFCQIKIFYFLPWIFLFLDSCA